MQESCQNTDRKKDRFRKSKLLYRTFFKNQIKIIIKKNENEAGRIAAKK